MSLLQQYTGCFMSLLELSSIIRVHIFTQRQPIPTPSLRKNCMSLRRVKPKVSRVHCGFTVSQQGRIIDKTKEICDLMLSDKIRGSVGDRECQ